MKIFFVILSLVALLISCDKEEDLKPEFSVEGYWNVLKDTSFTATSANASADLYHLFKGEHVFYRFSFLKTHNFADLNSKPRSDSLISYYQIKGNMLMLPTPAYSVTKSVPGNVLVKQTNDQMVFMREVVEKRNTITGEVEKTRIDTVKYYRVTDAVKIAWFDNYLKKWHPN
jgi:hypothetical protein